MSFKRIEKKSLADAVFEQLRDEIVSGRLEPGETLPAERGLSEMLGVNRGAVREALKRLQQARLVSIQQGGSTRVLNFRETAGTDMLATLLLHADGSINTHVARSVMEMRTAVATDITRLCARRAPPETVEELASIVEGMKENKRDLETLQDLSMQWWRILAHACDNVAYQLCVNSLHESYHMFKRVMLNVLTGELTDMEAYEKIVEALRNRDEDDAEFYARSLMKRGENAVLTLLEGLTPGDSDGE